MLRRDRLLGLWLVLGVVGCASADPERANSAIGGTTATAGSGAGSSTAGSSGTATGGGGAAGSPAMIDPSGDAGASAIPEPSPPVAVDAGASVGGGGAGGSDGESSEGCLLGGDLPEGEASIEVDGLVRSYILRKPAGYNRERSWPLVLALHPNGSTSAYWDNASGERPLRPLLEEEAVLVIPQASENDWRTYRPQNLAPDLAYFDALIGLVKQELCIDLQRIFSMGFSGGGSFSGALGCHRTDIRAFVSAGAVTYFQPDDCVGQPAAWVTIGEGELTAQREEFRDFWRSRNDCGTNTVPVEPSPCAAYDCPDPELPVHYCQHPDGHIWPDYATAASWAFFSQF